MRTVWNTWSARSWPVSLAEEAALVAELAGSAPRGAATRPSRPSRPSEALSLLAKTVDEATGANASGPLNEDVRDQVVWLVTALRCGASLTQMETLAPGLSRPDLLQAYVAVELRRRASVAAWRQLCRTPDVRTFREVAASAAQLLPVPVARIAAAAERSPAVLAETVAQCATAVHEAASRAHAIEAVLAAGRSPDAVQTGRALLDPTNPGWWDHGMYLPRRVGDVTPNRLRDLLGEEHR